LVLKIFNNKFNSFDILIGLYEETKAFIETLKQKNIFVRELDSSGIPYHSQYLESSVKKMTDALKKVIPNPKKRSKIWISTSVQSKKQTEDELKNASAEYFVNNLLNPVFFYNAVKALPLEAIVIEIGPHALFKSIFTKALESVSYVPLVKRNENDTNLELFLTSIGKLYELGVNPSIENLYPKVEFPVARNTQSIGSLIKWDHEESYFVRKYPEFHFRATASDMTVPLTISLRDDSYLKDHCIDGRVIFPATGYLMLAWRRLASAYGKIWSDLPVIFEDVQFRRPIFLSENETIKVTVKFHEPTGEIFFS
jgi:fatty acid synthase